MFEDGVLPRLPTGGAVGTPDAPAGAPLSVPQVSAEDTAGLLASLGAGRALAGVVEGLLTRLLVTAQDANDECSTADEDAVPPSSPMSPVLTWRWWPPPNSAEQ